MPTYLLPIVMQLIGVVPGLITQAEMAFSGKPGSGAAKKQFVIEGATALLQAMGTLKPGLMTPAQRDAIMATIASITDSIVMAINTAKLFDAPKAA